MPATRLIPTELTEPITITLTQGATTHVLPLDNSNPQAWSDFLQYLLQHPEIIIAFLQLVAMLLGGINPPPPPKP